MDRPAPVTELWETGSTNDVLKDLARQGAPHGTVVWARRQQKGRGRSGRSFLSPEGGVYLSILWRPELRPDKAVRLSCVGALAVCRGVEALCGLEAEIKWPNDVLVDGKKLCGILCESLVGESFALVLGLGINVNARTFPPELEGKATSLSLCTGRDYDPKAVAEEIVKELDLVYAAWGEDGQAFLEEYRRRSLPPGRRILTHREGSLAQAQVISIGDDYSLRLKWDDGTVEEKSCGEIFELF